MPSLMPLIGREEGQGLSRTQAGVQSVSYKGPMHLASSLTASALVPVQAHLLLVRASTCPGRHPWWLISCVLLGREVLAVNEACAPLCFTAFCVTFLLFTDMKVANLLDEEIPQIYALTGRWVGYVQDGVQSQVL